MPGFSIEMQARARDGAWDPGGNAHPPTCVCAHGWTRAVSVSIKNQRAGSFQMMIHDSGPPHPDLLHACWRSGLHTLSVCHMQCTCNTAFGAPHPRDRAISALPGREQEILFSSPCPRPHTLLLSLSLSPHWLGTDLPVRHTWRSPTYPPSHQHRQRAERRCG